MNEAEVVRELSRRASVSEESAEAVFRALRDLVREGAVDDRLLHDPVPVVANPRDPRLVDELIARARRHPMGIELLLGGLLGSVAIILGAHAFTVEAARARLRKEQEATAKKEKEEEEPVLV